MLREKFPGPEIASPLEIAKRFQGLSPGNSANFSGQFLGAKSFDYAQDGSKDGERPSTSLGTSPEFIEGRSRTTRPIGGVNFGIQQWVPFFLPLTIVS